MILSSDLYSIPDFLNMMVSFYYRTATALNNTPVIACTILFPALIALMLFGFLRRLKKTPLEQHEPQAPATPSHNQATQTSQGPENASVIVNLGSTSAEIRAKAARTLGERQAKQAIHALITLLQDDARNVRFWAAWALGSIRDQAAVNPLIDTLLDRDEGVRYRAAEALGEIGSPGSIDALKACLRDRSERVQKISRWALAQIDGRARESVPTEPNQPSQTFSREEVDEECRVEQQQRDEGKKSGESQRGTQRKESDTQTLPADGLIEGATGDESETDEQSAEMQDRARTETGERQRSAAPAKAQELHGDPVRFQTPAFGKQVRILPSEQESAQAKEPSSFNPRSIEEILKTAKERRTLDQDAGSRNISYLRHVVKQERTEELFLSESLEEPEGLQEHEAEIRINIRPIEAEGQFAAGVAFSQVGDWETAIDCYKKAIRFKPDMAKAYCNMGIAYCYRSSFKEGIFYLRQAIRFRPNWPKPYVNLGIAFSHDGDWEKAIGALKKGIRNPLEKLNAYYNLGVVYSRAGQWEKSAQAFALVVNSSPEDVQARCNLGIAYSYLGSWGEAAEAFRQSSLISPGDPRLQCCLGLLYCHLGRYDEGIKAFETAVRIKPEDVEAYCILGLAKAQLGLWDGAAAALNQAARIRSDFPEIQYYLGVIYEEQGRWKEAAQAFKQFVRIGNMEDNVPQLAFEGQRIPWEEMKKALTETIKYNPKMIEAYHLLGRRYEQRNEWQDASSAFMEAAKLKIREGQPNFTPGELGGHSFGRQRALEEIRRVILNKPEFLRPRYSLSASLNEFDRYERTSHALKRMIRVNPQNADTFYKLGRTCSYLGQYGAAITAYKEAARLAPENIMAHYYLALSYLAIGDRISAAEKYMVIRDLNEQLADVLFP